MIEIRNLLFQPLTFQLTGEEHGLHLGPRQTRSVEDALVSDEIKTAGERGFLDLKIIPPEFDPETMMSAPVDPGDGGSDTVPAVDDSTSADQVTDPSASTDVAPATDEPPADGQPMSDVPTEEIVPAVDQLAGDTAEPAMLLAADVGSADAVALEDGVQMAALSVSEDATTATRKRR